MKSNSQLNPQRSIRKNKGCNHEKAEGQEDEGERLPQTLYVCEKGEPLPWLAS